MFVRYDLASNSRRTKYIAAAAVVGVVGVIAVSETIVLNRPGPAYDIFTQQSDTPRREVLQRTPDPSPLYVLPQSLAVAYPTPVPDLTPPRVKEYVLSLKALREAGVAEGDALQIAAKLTPSEFAIAVRPLIENPQALKVGFVVVLALQALILLVLGIRRLRNPFGAISQLRREMMFDIGRVRSDVEDIRARS
jgi:hypothetical protein